MKADRYIIGSNFYFTPRIPMPILMVLSKSFRKVMIINFYLKFPRSSIRPRCSPVSCSYIDIIISLCRKLDGSMGIFYGGSHPVSDQIRATHNVHGLLIDKPSPFLVEGLGFNQYGFGLTPLIKYKKKRKEDDQTLFKIDFFIYISHEYRFILFPIIATKRRRG
jgi:hypothetical protein